MPLSDHEQRLLAQMEQALYAEDPTFANNLRTTSAGRASRGRAAVGVLAVLGGMGLVLAGVATMIIALGVIGFVVMLVGVRHQLHALACGVQKTGHLLRCFTLDAHGKAERAHLQVSHRTVQHLAHQVSRLRATQRAGAFLTSADLLDVVGYAHRQIVRLA